MQSILPASPGARVQDAPGRVTALLSPPWLFLHQWGTRHFQVRQVKFCGDDRRRSRSEGMGTPYSLEAAQAWPRYGLPWGGVRSPRLLQEQPSWRSVHPALHNAAARRPCAGTAWSTTLRSL